MVRPKFKPSSRARRVAPLLETATGIDPLTYRGTMAGVRRREPKRDKSLSARQAKKAQKAARRQLKAGS